jgi:uncharacterized membrane protein
MKIIGRTLIILIAALAVVGIIWMVGQRLGTNNLSGAGGRSRLGDFNPAGQPPSGGQRFAAGGFPDGGREGGEGRGGGFFGVFDVFKNLVVIGVIVLIVMGFSALEAGWQKLTKPKPAPASGEIPGVS